MDMKLEVVIVPVSDVDRAKDFYKRLGFREDVDYVRSLGSFAGVVFTCYLCKYSDDELVELAATRGIAMMAMFTHRYNGRLRERLHAAGCGVYVHTVNDPQEAANYRAQGVGIYTDFCRPK